MYTGEKETKSRKHRSITGVNIQIRERIKSGMRSKEGLESASAPVCSSA
jgi:hypothetical protein